MSQPHEILGVTRDASQEEIQSAYRRLAKIFHPDANAGIPDAHEKMSVINAAYEAMTNVAARPVSFHGFSGTVVRDESATPPSGRTCSRCKGTGFDPLDGIRREAGLKFGQYCSRCGGTGRCGGARATPPPRKKRESAETRYRREQGR